MTDRAPTIYLVDDEPSVLKALGRLLRSAGFAVAAFRSARDFMAGHEADAPGCLVVDVSMPEQTGLELQQWLARANSPLPVIFLTGRSDIPTSVQAMKAGAVDFLTKPVNEADLFRAVGEALRRERESRAARSELAALRWRFATLTPREREVLGHVAAGKPNKQIADLLGTVEKTIKVHRGRAMMKMGAESLPDLVRMAERLGVGGSRP